MIWRHLAQLLIVLNVLDLGTTIVAVGELGFEEANPLIAPFVLNPLFWIVKLVVPTMIALYFARKAQTEWSWGAFLVLGCLLYGAVVTNNIVGIIGALRALN
jgi:hypothetical protein